MIQISISNAIGSRGNGGVPSLAPVNTVAPVISGTSVVGYTLSSTTGTWTGTLPITYTYQWYRGASPIISATSSSYTLVNADEGQSITCQVTATNIAGSATTPSNAILVTSLLLDLYPSSSVAYSLRKLRTAYSGSAVRVRRSNDNAEQDIAFVNNELDTTSMLDFVGYNLWNYSEDISQTVYGVSRASKVTDVETAPDGTLTGDKFVEDLTLGEHGGSRGATTILNATSYNISAYFKQGERTKIKIYSNISGATQTCDLDLTNGNISNNGFANTPTVTAEANGWYRFSVTIASGLVSATTPLAIRFFNASNLISYTGDGTSGCYVWGYQLSQTSSVKTYQKTVATALGNGFVTTWYDQSTNANNSTQLGAGSQAQIVLNGNLRLDPNNGKVSTNLTNDFYSLTTNITIQQTFLSFAVVNRAATNGILSILGSDATSNRRIFHWASNGDITSNIAAAGLVTHATADTATGDYIISALRDSSSVVKAWKNASALSTGTSTGTTDYSRIMFASATSIGWMQELILWNNQNLESSRSAIETAINTYYSVY